MPTMWHWRLLMSRMRRSTRSSHDAAKDHRPISGALPKRPARDNGGRCRLHHRRNSETPARARGRRQDAACIELTAAFRRLRALRPVVGCKPPSASFLTGCFMTRRLSLRRSGSGVVAIGAESLCRDYRHSRSARNVALLCLSAP
jgi:hypothetical protein